MIVVSISDIIEEVFVDAQIDEQVEAEAKNLEQGNFFAKFHLKNDLSLGVYIYEYLFC